MYITLLHVILYEYISCNTTIAIHVRLCVICYVIIINSITGIVI